MRIIIDTHIFLWALAEPHKIKPEKREQLETATNTIYVSSISITEIMLKASMGKLNVNFDPVQAAKESGFEILDYRGEDALPLQNLPFHHKDPFDRMLIAQSLSRDYAIMSDDSKFNAYDCKLI
jgi:PIN domain nuclease of toxin-antitoxin system